MISQRGLPRTPSERGAPGPQGVGYLVSFQEEGAFPEAHAAEQMLRGIERGAALAVVTRKHRELLQAALAHHGVDVEAALAQGRLAFLDAEEALAELQGDADEQALEAVLGRRVREALGRFGALWVFGELVDLLSKRGSLEAAGRVEEFWGRLIRAHRVHLLCSYGLGSFDPAQDLSEGARADGPALAEAPMTIVAHLEQRRRALRQERARRQELEEEQRQQQRAERFLAEAGRLFSSSLDYEATVARVAQLTVPTFADWCMVDLVTDDGQSFDRVAVGHHLPGGEEVARSLRRRYPLRPDIQQGLVRAMVDRKPVLLRDMDDALLRAVTCDHEHLSAARALSMRSGIIAPLVARGRTIGALSLAVCGRNFNEHDRIFVEQLALSAAAAIDNARLFEAERRGRVRLAKMQEVTAALSRASTAEEVAATTCRIGSEAMQAQSGAIWLLRGDGALALAGSWGTPAEFIEPFRVLPAGMQGAPALEVLRTRRAIWIESEEDFRRTAPEIFTQARAAGRVTSYGAVPLWLGGGVGGVLCFSHPVGHRYDQDEREFYTALGQNCSQALDRARLLDAERRTNDRLRLLAQAGETLTQSLDLSETLRAVARLFVPAVADWFVIDLVEGPLIRRVAIEHVDPEKARLAERIAGRHPAHLGDGSPIARVIADGKTRFLPRVPPEALAAAARDDDERRLMDEEGVRSSILVPLLAQGGCIGAISLTTTRSGRVFDHEDLRFVEELGRRAVLAIANARMHAEVRSTEQRMRLALEAGDIGAWDLDIEADRLVWDARCRAIYGFAQGAPLDRATVLARLHPDDRARNDEALARALAPGGSGDLAIEYRIARANDGAERWVCARGKVTFDHGRPVRMVGTLADTTDDREAEAERARWLEREREARAEAEAANRIKDEFLATVSHELRTPLHAIRGWTDLLATRAHDEAAVSKGLAVIHRNVQAQSKLVDDILDVSRIITGKLKIEPTPVDMVAIARDALDVVRPSADAKRISLRMAVPQEGTCWLVGDAQRLQQAVWNLLSNAVKFTEPGGEVVVGVEQEGAVVSVTVADNGRGIEPDFLPHLFQRFRQGDGSSTRKFGGLGLGLSLVRHIIELHGGQVSGLSAGPGRGASFRLALPVRAVAPSPHEEASPGSSGAPSLPAEQPDVRGLRVLVVDDEDDARELLTMVLSQEGAVVQTASSAREALDVLDRFLPDVIVSDIGMPDEDGHSLLRKVRQRQGANAVPAVALTAYTRAIDRQRALEAGFRAHLKKPVDSRELISTLARVRRPSR